MMHDAYPKPYKGPDTPGFKPKVTRVWKKSKGSS